MNILLFAYIVEKIRKKEVKQMILLHNWQN